MVLVDGIRRLHHRPTRCFLLKPIRGSCLPGAMGGEFILHTGALAAISSTLLS